VTDTSPPYTVALDAMGGDAAPAEQVKGAIAAARDTETNVLLVGDPDALKAELGKHDTDGLSLQVIPSEGMIEEGEHPMRALRQKPKASIAVATGLVKEGLADAVVSMGSTGAAMGAAVLAFGLFPGLERPTLGGPFIGLAPRVSLIDLGTQIDCRPSQLLSFAALGCTFSRLWLKIEEPRVALLSVGSEPGKGNRQVQEAYPLFEASGLRFVGNIEGHELFLDKADVVVCDGFVGNVLLKYTEGLGHAAARYLSEALGPDAPAVQHLRELGKAAESSGGPLFGVNGIAIIGHGRSKAGSIAASIAMGQYLVEVRLVENMRQELAALLQRTANAPQPTVE
jgi:glycerol-3-phosphate acyltransferase PlsX